jgi:hypothetical protein
MNRRFGPRARGGVRAVLLCCLGLSVGSAASAAPIDLNTWYEFSWFEQGGTAAGCDPADPNGDFCIPSAGTPTSFAPEPAWTFDVAATGATLTVVDAFLSGDRFTIFDFGIPIGSTSVPAVGFGCGADPVVCLAEVHQSSGVFSLLPGAHALTIVATTAPSQSGAGYFQVTGDAVDAVVPEPTTILLIASGLAALIVRPRQRRAP